jgi:beta-glucosidase
MDSRHVKPRAAAVVILMAVTLAAAAASLTARAGDTPSSARRVDRPTASDGLPSAATAMLATTRRPASCPWATAAALRNHTPAQLAAEVVAHMTLSEKIGFVGLAPLGIYENENAGVPGLCVPSLTLQDGPDGLAGGATGVTQLPASVGVAASFDPAVAAQYGAVLGSEAKSLGVDVVQGPNLNVARLPNSGRIYEGYGEDPTLVSAMGVAEIEAIQAQGVMAMVKHFSGYTQETDRSYIDQRVSERVLQEIYFPPFKAAVEEAHVASVMCAAGQIDGTETCQSKDLFTTLESEWGFAGFVRTDEHAFTHTAAAFDAGVDLIKPCYPTGLVRAIRDGRVPISTLDNAITRVLAEMFRFGLIVHPLPETSGPCDCANHSHVALTTAERSMVLLKNAGGVLPLDRTKLKSIAVIGQDAGSHAMTAGYGSSHVIAPLLSTPLAAIRQWAGKRVPVSYSAGGPPVPAGSGTDVRGLHSLHVSTTMPQAAGTADSPGTGPGWLEHDTTVTPKESGLYDFSLTSIGDTWLTVGGTRLISEPGVHQANRPWSATVRLTAGHRYLVKVRWFDVGVAPALTWTDVTPMIEAAVKAARHASVAFVFANDFTSEGFDRPTLTLPGDADALISAVAAANPRTVVVLNTGGAVVMPWLSKVKAVLEAWYPGEEDGAATLAVLTGAVDPSGHLPLTFPTSVAQSPMGKVTSWPGVDGVVSLGGLDEGYRYYVAHGIRLLFPFGFGLSYTRFSLSGLKAIKTPGGYRLSVELRNDGARSGRAVVQAYLRFPSAAHEPGHKLVAFDSVPLPAHAGRRAALSVPRSALQCYLGDSFQTVPGTYTLSVGQDEAHLPLHISFRVS